ncbi:uncharacterized protein TRIADDRAFT_56842 [Trichoplax adhaerens]|uniref:Transmembrane protein 184C n=1 Tax=Trichoplax adhaerens TaxID=10228 RepID=B3RWQ7_TRIAD|nr:hypothetical protein TRIADDRAFT_56842 [Trichoplax adhaerens]EDV25173.1 hypothetical protein TRIADDRAFT_56842 [Trichoplax adhaerens]|eukprot:XP_002113063.1 hypothetical protein TRIADDRAFT_56842 [Trichoplax adhaerens]
MTDVDSAATMFLLVKSNINYYSMHHDSSAWFLSTLNNIECSDQTFLCKGKKIHLEWILWMVPIYSLNSWIALRFPKIGFYFDTVRRCYEAYVLYNFMVYLLNFLKTEYDIVARLQEKPQITHVFPFCKLKAWKNGRPFLIRCKQGVLTYVVIMPLTTLIALGCHLAGAYHEGEFNFAYPYPYIIIIDNFTQLIALYCLTLFYKAFKEELKPIKPIGKFAAIKFIIFFSFWQDCFISVLVDTGVIRANKQWNFYDPELVAKGLQNFLICIEMFIVALLHYFVFSHKPYIDGAAPHTSLYTSFMSMWDVSDVHQDVVEHMKGVGKFNLLGRAKRSRNPMEVNLLAEETELNEAETSRLLENTGSDSANARTDGINESETAVIISGAPDNKVDDLRSGVTE